jgi:hypothetical protein
MTRLCKIEVTHPPGSGVPGGFITTYNTRFGRDPANTKDLHRPLTQADDLDEILAWREERTVTSTSRID